MAQGFNIDDLFKFVGDAQDEITGKLGQLKSDKTGEGGKTVDLAELLKFQYIMNTGMQKTEIVTGMLSALHTAQSSIARGMKG